MYGQAWVSKLAASKDNKHTTSTVWEKYNVF